MTTMTSTRLKCVSASASDLTARQQGLRPLINRTFALWRAAGLLLLLAILAGCVASPVERLASQARLAGLQPVSLPAADFMLQGFERATAGRHARIYIEGDGRPWRAGGRVIADDPSPRNLPALTWMASLPGPSLYLGRPCYFQASAQPACNAMLWTYGRYSDQVVAVMAQGLQSWLQRHPQIDSLTLVGHSGGGVLALLLAERVPAVVEVVTLAAPTDVALWAQLHEYTPLFASLNPADIEQWRPQVRRRLFFGEQDRQVPPASFAPSAQSIPGAQISVVLGIGHDCCAPTLWADD